MDTNPYRSPAPEDRYAWTWRDYGFAWLVIMGYCLMVTIFLPFFVIAALLEPFTTEAQIKRWLFYREFPLLMIPVFAYWAAATSAIGVAVWRWLR